MPLDPGGLPDPGGRGLLESGPSCVSGTRVPVLQDRQQDCGLADEGPDGPDGYAVLEQGAAPRAGRHERRPRPVRTKPVVLVSGRICAGGSVERGEWQAFCDFSDDDGQTWTKGPLLGLNLLTGNAEATSGSGQERLPSELPPLSPQSFNGRGVIQPALWQEMNGRLHMYMRSTEGYLYSSISEDDGRTWTDPVATALYNNNSGFDLIRTPGGRLFLACNPVSGNWGARTPLSLFLGREDGSEWEVFCRVQTGKGEYSYPSLTYTFGGLWCSYTYNRTAIALCFLTWKDIAARRKFRVG